MKEVATALMTLISADEIRDVSVRALRRRGVPQANAEAQADLLLEAEIRGVSSHGLLRLPRVLARIDAGAANPTTQGLHRWAAPGLLDVDGDQGLGPVVALRAIAVAQQRAATQGVVVAAIRHNNHIGMLAYYAEKVARSGQVLIAMTSSEALVHPAGGREALVGSNPIAFGVPAGPDPLVVDMATSAVSAGKIIDHANRGFSLEQGWAVDQKGAPTTDAAAARAGAISPFGGSKGYALGLAIGAATGWATCSAFGRGVTGTLDDTLPATKGDLFIVLDGTGESAADLSTYLQAIRSSAPANGSLGVRVPGDRSRATRARTLEGGVSLPEPLWDSLRQFAEGQR
jgi:L-2-hydroxycarboxylate dehydrogenase (NAD+)